MSAAVTLDIAKDVIIDAPVERVFAAFTNPKLLVQFWGEGVNRWESDLRPGGRWSSSGTLPGGGTFCVKGAFRQVHPESLVEMTVEHAQPGVPNTLLRLNFSGAGDKTWLRIRHSGFASEQFCSDHSKGWDGIVARLIRFLSLSYGD